MGEREKRIKKETNYLRRMLKGIAKGRGLMEVGGDPINVGKMMPDFALVGDELASVFETAARGFSPEQKKKVATYMMGRLSAVRPSQVVSSDKVWEESIGVFEGWLESD